MVCIALVCLVIIHLDVPLQVTSAPVVPITVTKGARLLVLHWLELGIALNIVHMSFILIPSEFHGEEGTSVRQVFLLWLVRSMWVLLTVNLN